MHGVNIIPFNKEEKMKEILGSRTSLSSVPLYSHHSHLNLPKWICHFQTSEWRTVEGLVRCHINIEGFKVSIKDIEVGREGQNSTIILK